MNIHQTLLLRHRVDDDNSVPEMDCSFSFQNVVKPNKGKNAIPKRKRTLLSQGNSCQIQTNTMQLNFINTYLLLERRSITLHLKQCNHQLCLKWTTFWRLGTRTGSLIFHNRETVFSRLLLLNLDDDTRCNKSTSQLNYDHLYGRRVRGWQALTTIFQWKDCCVKKDHFDGYHADQKFR